MRTAVCKACGRPIVWIRTIKGKAMPCDAEPIPYMETPKGKEKIQQMMQAELNMDSLFNQLKEYIQKG